MTKPGSVWTLAGHDPFGGAGIQADLRVGAALGVPMRSLITSFTAQNDKEWIHGEAFPLEWLKQQWDALHRAERPSAVKIGLLLKSETLRFLAAQTFECPLIYDPVLSVSSGPEVVPSSLLADLREYLWPKLSLLTPNIPEAEKLVGRRITTLDDVKQAAKSLREQGLKAVLIKGGHAAGDKFYDYFDDGVKPFFLESERIEGQFRGTGCTLSAAIASALAKGFELRDAVVFGHSYVQAAIRLAAARSDNHLPPYSETPATSSLYYDEIRSYRFAPMPRSIGFYTVAPDAEWIRRLAKARVPTLQLRAKDLKGEDLRKAVKSSQDACEAHQSLFFLNDDWRLALDMKAFGVHLGQEDLDALSAGDLETLAGSGLRLGISTHSWEEAARAKALNPSYIALGPVFETSCKSMRFGPQGLSRVGDWVKSLPHIPVVAIGGLKQEHAKAVLQEGADGIAVISDITQAKDPESRVNEWLNSWPS